MKRAVFFIFLLLSTLVLAAPTAQVVRRPAHWRSLAAALIKSLSHGMTRRPVSHSTFIVAR